MLYKSKSTIKISKRYLEIETQNLFSLLQLEEIQVTDFSKESNAWPKLSELKSFGNNVLNEPHYRICHSLSSLNAGF